jgi:N-formylglutamate amidohydrolase
MFNCHAMADKVSALAFEKIERRLEALLAEHGASDPNELPHAIQIEILRRAMIETAVANFPTADLETLDHHARSLAHPAFIPACERVRLATKQGSDAG